MAEGATEKLAEGAKKALVPAKGSVWRKVGWGLGVIGIILLGWRFRAQLMGLLYRIPILGNIFAMIAGDTAGGGGAA